MDTLFYAAANPQERYDPQRTLRRQGRVYLSTGSVLYSNLGNPLLTIVADTCGRHDTLGGACSQESNTVRYALDRRQMHSCRDNFLCAGGHDGRLGKRDIGANINFFMNVPVTADGGLTFADGISAPASMWSCAPRPTSSCLFPIARNSTTPATAGTPLRRRCCYGTDPRTPALAVAATASPSPLRSPRRALQLPRQALDAD